MLDSHYSHKLLIKLINVASWYKDGSGVCHYNSGSPVLAVVQFPEAVGSSLVGHSQLPEGVWF